MGKRNPQALDSALSDFNKLLKNEKMRENEKELINVAVAQKEQLKKGEGNEYTFPNLSILLWSNICDLLEFPKVLYS